MKKTSIYLDEMSAEIVRKLAEQEKCSQADIIRRAIEAYGARLQSDRNFALTASWKGDGTSVADISEEELLDGFGN